MAVKTFVDNVPLPATDINTYLNNGGLVYIASATLNAVTNNISNVFSSTYDSYRVVISNLSNASASSRVVYIRYRTASDDTSANYHSMQYFSYGTNLAGNASVTGATAAEILTVSSGGNSGGAATIDIVNPNLATSTQHFGHRVTFQNNVSTFVYATFGGGINTNTQYTGFTILGTTDALSGTVRVYGYRQA